MIEEQFNLSLSIVDYDDGSSLIMIGIKSKDNELAITVSASAAASIAKELLKLSFYVDTGKPPSAVDIKTKVVELSE